MKILSLALLLIASLAFVLLGCSDNSSSVVAPSAKTIPPANAVGLAKSSPLVHSVTGNANIWLAGKMGVLTINGHLYEDGSVKGVLNLVTTAFNPVGSKMHGKVVALTFYDNYSFSNGLSGPTVLLWWIEDTYVGMEGKYFAYFVVDNGQDINGLVHDWTGPTAGPYDTIIDLEPQAIADMYPWAFVPLDVGNVTIR